MMYTMPKNLLSICVNFTLATQPIRMREKMTLMSLYPIGFVWYTISAKA